MNGLRKLAPELRFQILYIGCVESPKRVTYVDRYLWKIPDMSFRGYGRQSSSVRGNDGLDSASSKRT